MFASTISKFYDDSQQLSDSKVLEFWAYHDYDGSKQPVQT
jgi:hypothetical protein